jgi:hypothetical protein
MKTRNAETSTNPRQGRGPSLYSVETSTSKDPLEGLSILGALEPAPLRSRVRRRGLLALATVVLLLPVTWLVATSPELRQSMPSLALAMPEFKAGSAKEPIPDSVQNPPAVTEAPIVTVVDTATIMTEPSAGKSAFGDAPAVAYPEIGMSQAQLQAVTSPEVEKAPELAKNKAEASADVASGQHPQRKETKEPKFAANDRARRADTRHTAVAQGPAAANPAKNGKSTDKDVDLIAALLTHVSRPGATPKEASKSPATSLALAGSAAKRDNRSANHDIVMHAPGVSKESLIARCRTLGFLEGELCRIRICSGSWGTDPACSMDSAVRGE